MAEYSRKQRNQLSRAVANGDTGSRQLKEFVDNNPHIPAQAKMINGLQKSPNANVIQKFAVPKNYNTHVAGEIIFEKKKEKGYKGGHSQPLMIEKWKKDLDIVGEQSNEAAYRATWSLRSKPLKGKESTFFPNAWDYNKIVAQIESTNLTGGKNSAESESGILIAKSGDTAYPVV